MSTSRLLPLALLLLLQTTWMTQAAVSKTRVLDISGKKLRSGAEYYILPVFRGRGGGLTLAPRNDSCPLQVAQEASEVSNGLPVKFSPVKPQEHFIPLGTDLNVVFSAATICVDSTVWRLGGLDENTRRRYITTGGVTGNPGLQTVSNWFKIDKYGEGKDYKLVFCPQVCNFCKVICGDIGVFVEDGKRWLGLSDNPFPVMFKKV